ncbi:hypothetical protein HYW75_02205 [Candidatus Pacearchaeota archaeon]|nr:hypothetical protein [Candidatus Pacearchaeota archaeon]
MEVDIKSRTNKDISYCFSDRSPEGLLKDSPHLADNFSYDPSKPVNREKFREVINDLAHPEIQAAFEDGFNSVVRFFKAFNIKTKPLYIYRIDRTFYEQKVRA